MNTCQRCTQPATADFRGYRFCARCLDFVECERRGICRWIGELLRRWS